MSDKIYCVTQGEAPFDWWLAIKNPDLHDHNDLTYRARMWTTCACGNQCAIIQRRINTEEPEAHGVPEDEELRNLGYVFYGQIKGCLWGEAQKTLVSIEARSRVLIAEELAKRNQQPA